MGYEGLVTYEIFEESVNSVFYKGILENDVIPFFMKRKNIDFIFQHDGAPAHSSHINIGLLNKFLNNRWIGKDSSLTEWPPKSPDLTVCDYFLWGYLKDKVYSHILANLNDLRFAINEEITKIPLEMIRKSVDNIEKRCKKCLKYNGDHFEMFLDRECD
uniref:Tc1-like transposase DDE domain-containing protein n=1 Tax=Strongyloides stercoralis TaxID=6248 RepID=A0A0K0E084_STRER